MDVGLYGKLPSHGDFLRRRVSDAFVDLWDPWLQECIAASRSALGERWLDLYLTSPAWRFVLSADVCGPAAMMGLMVPSVDRVGRYFPLTIATEIPPDIGPLVAAVDGATFLATAEQLLVDTLAEDEVDFERFDGRVMRLGESLSEVMRRRSVVLDPSAATVLAEAIESGWRLPLGHVSELSSVCTQLLSHRLAELHQPLALWWTDGSAAVEPSWLITRGLPQADGFRLFLDGSSAGDQWRTVGAAVEASPGLDETLRMPMPMTWRSVGQTDVGRVRTVNQDAFLERPDIGLWVVADGLGGHTDGEVASRMVCDALADFTPPGAFDELVEGVRRRILQVNDHLLHMSARNRGGKIGSTVVVLLTRGAEAALLWAGDSRIYRLRDSRLAQLTRDHSAAMSMQGVRVETNVITRAVGVAQTLLLDEIRVEVRSGDRFLLCSDGLTRKMRDEQIEAWMQHGDIDVTVEGLIETTLEAGAPDNVTAVVVEAVSA